MVVRSLADFDEAVVEGEVVAKRVLPTRAVLAVEWKVVHDELVDLAQRHHLAGRTVDGHRTQRNVTVRWFVAGVRTLTWTRHLLLL